MDTILVNLDSLFIHLLNMSITAGWLVLAVVLLRLVFHRAPKWIHCLLWVLVAVRLICPFSVESVLSLLPSAETVPVEDFLYETPSIHSGVPAVDDAVNPVLSDNFAPQPGNSVNPMQVVAILSGYVWLLGVVLMAVYMLITTLRLKWRVRESVRLQRNVYQCDRIATPFILGVIRPRIYLPTTLSQGDVLSVVAHEQAHIKRRDHWWKPLGFLLLAVYWFNPLLWLGYVLLCRDIEAACDQRVIRDMDVTQRKAYSDTLLACSAPRHLITACPLAFGETGVKSRVKAVLNYKKPAFWLVIAAVVAVAVAAVCLLTNPKATVSDELDAFLTQVILEENAGEHTGAAYPTEAHTVFGMEEKDGKTVVYTLVLYEEYYLDENGALQVQSGSHIPTAITVDVEGSGYALVEYWTPGEGAYYLPDMKAKFPFFYRIQVDTDKYYDTHHKQTQQAAAEYFSIEDSSAMNGGTTHSTTPKTTTTQVADNTFTGKVTQVTDGSMLMECYDKQKFTTVWVLLTHFPDLNPQVGEEYTVTHDGRVMETFPPQVTAEAVELLTDSKTTVITKENTWQTLGHPMTYNQASQVSDGYPLSKDNKQKLQTLLDDVAWYSDAAPTDSLLFDAYFSLDGVNRYYVSLDTWGTSGCLYNGKEYAELTEEQAATLEFMLPDGGSTVKATHVLYGYFAEWNKNERCYVLDAVQADDATLVGKKIRVNTQNLYGSGLPSLGVLLKVSYDGTVLGDTVYAMGLAVPPEEELPKVDPSTVVQDGNIVGKVIFVMDKAVLLNCYDKTQLDVVWVRYTENCPQLTPQLYEEYQVAFSGQTMETYPPQIIAQTMTQVSSTPLDNGYIGEKRAIEIAIARWGIELDEPDMLNGYYATVYVMENPTADNPRYKLGCRKVDTLGNEPRNSMLYYTMEIDAVTGEVLADSYVP